MPDTFSIIAGIGLIALMLQGAFNMHFILKNQRLIDRFMRNERGDTAEQARQLASAIRGQAVTLSDLSARAIVNHLRWYMTGFFDEITTRLVQISQEKKVEPVTNDPVYPPKYAGEDIPIPLISSVQFQKMNKTQQSGYILALGSDSRYAQWYKNQSAHFRKEQGADDQGADTSRHARGPTSRPRLP